MDAEDGGTSCRPAVSSTVAALPPSPVAAALVGGGRMREKAAIVQATYSADQPASTAMPSQIHEAGKLI